jgi:hypothetical protein
MITTSSQSITALGIFKEKMPFLAKPEEYSFENFMRMYLTNQNQFFFNLLTTNIKIEGTLASHTFYKITVNKRVPWTTLSYNEYRNMNLWWLIMIVNNIKNPLSYPAPGTELKILYPKYVKKVITTINKNLK